MSFERKKALVLVIGLLVSTCLLTSGCGNKKSGATTGMVNTKSMPGSTFKQHDTTPAKRHSTTIVYLGDEYQPRYDGFGPKDISFEFHDLRK